MKTAIVLGLGLIALELATVCYPPLGGVIIWLISSRGKQCNVMETMRSVAYAGNYQKAFQRIQASARIVAEDGDLRLWDIPGERQFWLPGNLGRRNIITFGEQAAGNYWHPSVHINRGDIVLDVGADYGSVTWQALRSGAQKVIAIEIAPQKWPCLKRTFAKEIADGRVAVVEVGVWDRDGVLELDDDSVVLQRGARKQTVRVTTIDQIVSGLHIPRVDFISMDIEGAEKAALRGAAGTLRKFKPRMVIASEHLSDDVVAIPQTVRAIVSNYEVFCGRCTRRDNRLLAEVLWFK
jgi:FkbM family methyltransferase